MWNVEGNNVTKEHYLSSSQPVPYVLCTKTSAHDGHSQGNSCVIWEGVSEQEGIRKIEIMVLPRANLDLNVVQENRNLLLE